MLDAATINMLAARRAEYERNAARIRAMHDGRWAGRGTDWSTPELQPYREYLRSIQPID